MKNNCQVVNERYQYMYMAGFTAIELLGVLCVTIIIIVVTNQIVNGMSKTKEINEVSDQSQKFSQIAVAYLSDNYRQIVLQSSEQDIIIPFSQLRSYYPTGTNIYNKKHQMPCIYVKGGIHNNTIQAYLIFGNSSLKAKSYNYIDVSKIAQNIGANAGVFVDNGAGYTFKGGIDNNFTLNTSQIDDLVTTCNFTNKLPQNTIIIDLNKNEKLFAAIRGNIDQQTTVKDSDPTLKKSGMVSLTTMQTNLYLDNIVKESSTSVSHYCDSHQIPIQEAITLCQIFATNNTLILNSGTAMWGDSLPKQDDVKFCLSSAEADFDQDKSGYTCQGVSFGDVNTFCGQTHGSENILPDSAYWIGNVNNPVGAQCAADGYAKYQQLSNCNFSCTELHQHNLYNCPDDPEHLDRQNLNDLCDTSHGWWPRGVGEVFSGQAVGNNKCHVEFWCSNTADHYNRASGNINANTFQIDPIHCGTKTVRATPTTTRVYAGHKQCGSKYTEAFESKNYFPDEHVYKALDFGQNFAGNQVQLKSDAPSGVASTTSQLDINNAGLQASYIAPVSHLITPGTFCSASDIGKMAQQFSSTINLVGGQLQCIYNPTYCPGAGYCFLPIKSTSFEYQYNTLHTNGFCPYGTAVANNQPIDGILTSVTCPIVSGLALQGLTGETNICYTNATGFTFCNGYHSVCIYRNSNGVLQEIEVAALQKLKCTNSTTTYLVNNYRPN